LRLGKKMQRVLRLSHRHQSGPIIPDLIFAIDFNGLNGGVLQSNKSHKTLEYAMHGARSNKQQYLNNGRIAFDFTETLNG